MLTHCVGSPEEDLSDAAVTLEAVVEAMSEGTEGRDGGAETFRFQF